MNYIFNIADVQQVRPGSALVWSWSLWVAQTTRLLLLMGRTLQVHTELSIAKSSTPEAQTTEGRGGEGRAHH